MALLVAVAHNIASARPRAPCPIGMENGAQVLGNLQNSLAGTFRV